MINFVSNLPKDLWTGGFSAMNAAAFSAISACDWTHYVGPINPSPIPWERALSKCRRLAGFQGSFFFFSKRRLASIAGDFHARYRVGARLDFFHGFTPWIMTRPEHPYIAWSDCTFRDYVDIFCNRKQFETNDLERIQRAEADWLRNAHRVLFTSEWAAKRAVKDYSLKAEQVVSVGIFGNIEVPLRDAYAGGQDFVFVSTNFDAKGGRALLWAFREIKKRHSSATLTIIGDRPSDVRAEPGTIFTGLLRKEVQHERRRFEEILSQARALVHPTKSDIAPLIVVEAGYLGCPAIASRRFAIPELVDHGRTGLLIDDPSEPQAVARAMCWMLENPLEYEQMRQAAWAKARGLHSRSEFERRLLGQVHVR